MARELLTLRGHAVTGLSPAAMVTRALHTTSDFGIILGDTVGRTLRAAYQAAPSGIRQLGRQTSARDFRAVNKIMLGEAPLLEKLGEHGEIKAGTMAESREAYKIETWARKIGITRQVIVNDDLGAFSDLARRMGQGGARSKPACWSNWWRSIPATGRNCRITQVSFNSDVYFLWLSNSLLNTLDHL
jgi:hypothetical protein